jgi:hypothetical protein
MNQIQVFGKSGLGVSRLPAERCSAPPMRLHVIASIRSIRARKAPDFWRWCKLLISRRLSPFFAFSTPFLSCKRLISRRLQRKHSLIEFAEGIAERELTQRGLDCFTRSRSFRTGIRRELGRSRQTPASWPGLSRIVPPGPALSRVQFFLGHVFLAKAGGACTHGRPIKNAKFKIKNETASECGSGGRRIYAAGKAVRREKSGG